MSIAGLYKLLMIAGGAIAVFVLAVVAFFGSLVLILKLTSKKK